MEVTAIDHRFLDVVSLLAVFDKVTSTGTQEEAGARFHLLTAEPHFRTA